jgi:hypothetical protein
MRGATRAACVQRELAVLDPVAEGDGHGRAAWPQLHLRLVAEARGEGLEDDLAE